VAKVQNCIPFSSIEVIFQLKEREIQDLRQHPPILFPQKKKGKKRKPPIKWRDAKMQGR
jgi:hypothetical protein